MYSLYSIPNVVMVFFGGLLGDKIGYRISSLIFGSLVLSGSVAMAIGASLSSSLASPIPYYIVLAGRLVYGLDCK